MITKNFKQLFSSKLYYSTGRNIKITGTFKATDGTSYENLYTPSQSSSSSTSGYEALITMISFRGVQANPTFIKCRLVNFTDDISEDDYQLLTAVATPIVTIHYQNTENFAQITFTNGTSSDITFNGYQIYEMIYTDSNSSGPKDFLVIEEKFEPITIEPGQSKTWQIAPVWN